MPRRAPLLPLLLAVAAPATASQDRIDRLLTRAPVIDGHNDLAWEVRRAAEAGAPPVDIAADTASRGVPLQTDLARLRRGHVGGQFWSVWIPADVTGPRAVEMTLEQIDIVRRLVAAHPGALQLATTAADIRRIARSGRVASLIGVEGGHQIDGRLSVLRQYRALGAGYMTLTHTLSLDWADASTGAARAGGLSPFGRQVVAEMNRIGMIVDISHVSDATAAAAIAASRAPVIASHSGARAVADAPRNLPDDLLRAVAAKDGLVMVNFYPAFLSTAWRAWDGARTAFAKAHGLPADLYGRRAPLPLAEWDRTHPEPRVDVGTVADMIDHVARVAGAAHVGLGGDFDGIGGTAPIGLPGVDAYPALFRELARRGWSDKALVALAQGNILRVMEQVEAIAAASTALPPVEGVDRASR